MDILDMMSKRHSFYALNNKVSQTKEEITDIIKTLLKLYPSSFNTQSARLLVLYAKEHLKFWQMVESELLKTAPKEKADSIKQRIESFKQGFGTILYFDDCAIVRDLEKKMPLYAENFKIWSHESNAMLQYMIWTAFANNRIGASLQHYNPLINEIARKSYDIPQSWELVAQMPFGSIVETPLAHTFENIDDKLIIKD